MNTETATNPVEGAQDFASFEAEVTKAAETEVETQTDQQPDQQFDDAGNPIAEPEEDEEVELDDLKLKVSKAAAAKLKELKDGRLMQADYTRKTQAVAERERAVEALQQASQEEINARAVAQNISAQLAQYQGVNWENLMRQAQANINQAAANYDDAAKDHWQATLNGLHTEQARAQQLERDLSKVGQHYAGIKQQREFATQQETAKQIDEGRAAVQKIPGWAGEQTHAELKAIATAKEIGFTADEIGDEISINPKVARALMYAKKGLEAERNERKTANLAAGQAITPIQAVKGSSGVQPIRADTDDFKAFERLMASKLKPA